MTPTEQAAAFQSFYDNVIRVVYDTTTSSGSDASSSSSSSLPTPVLVGPDSGYLNPQAWLEGFLASRAVSSPSSPFPLQAVTHHVYTGVEQQNYNSPQRLDHPRAEEAAWYTAIVRNASTAAFHPQAWAGENGCVVWRGVVCSRARALCVCVWRWTLHPCRVRGDLGRFRERLCASFS